MKHFTIGLLILISHTTYATNTMKLTHFFSDSLEKKFWQYFQSQVDNDVDSFILSMDKRISVNKKLDEYFPGLSLGTIQHFLHGKRTIQIYVTARGNKSKFSSVEKLVKKAPKTNNYSIVAFSPPSYLQDSLSFNGKIIPTDNIEFVCTKNKNEFDVNFFFPNKPTKTDNEFQFAFQELLFEFLGEIQLARLGLVGIFGIDEKQNQQTKKIEELYSVLTKKL